VSSADLRIAHVGAACRRGSSKQSGPHLTFDGEGAWTLTTAEVNLVDQLRASWNSLPAWLREVEDFVRLGIQASMS